MLAWYISMHMEKDSIHSDKGTWLLCCGENAVLHDAHLKKIEELKRFHLKSKATVHHEQDQISVLGSINHPMQILHSSNPSVTGI